ncbi:MAG: putative Ig domain-containing protein, partial [Candidatus Solibacter sp.]
MKLSLRLYIFAFLICQFSFAGIGPPVGQCANCLIKPNLPALEVAVSDNEGDNTAVSLLTDTVRGAGNTVIPAGYDIQNGDYLAWCVDTPTFPVFGSFRLTAPLSTLDPVLLALNPGFNKVNYILNHKNGADYHDIQRAIWTVLGLSGGISASFPPDAGSTAALIAAADAHPGYQPGPGEVMGLVMPADGFGGRLQDTMLELPVPKCGTIGDFVWVDTNHDGLQNDGNTGINGVTVTLTDSSGNLLAFTVTANAPNGYTALTGLPPNAPGYYQFTGLCAGTYKVVVNDSQPGLTGYTRTLDTVGFPANSAIDSNRNIDNVVLLTDHTIDETIDFGYTVPSLLASCASAITGTPGVPYSSFILASGGSTPYTFTLNSGLLPGGLNLNSSTGEISGTPNATGVFNFTVKVTDSTGLAHLTATTSSCGITVSVIPPTATCVSIAAVQGVAITPVTMLGSGGAGAPFTFSATGLPAGLSMASDGTISGTPGANGTFPYVVTVKDKDGNAGTTNCSVTVLAAPSATCVTIVAVQGVAIAPVTMLGTGGTGGPYTFSATGLPAGVTMASDGTISGTPGSSGTFPYVVTVKDKDGNIGTVNCSMTVNASPSANCVAIVAVQGVAITP